jgi:hypothetical protein
MNSDEDRTEGSDGRDDLGGGGDVDRHLDEMFDRLAGTGAAGRRALAEAEDHLRAAVADEISRGLPAARAERNAVERFGSPARIAGDLRRAHRVSPLGSTLSGAWLLAGLAILVLAGTYLVKTLDLAVLLRMHPERSSACAEMGGGFFVPAPGAPSPCPGAGVGAALHDNALAGLVALLLAVVVLLGRRLAIRRAGLAPAPRRFPLLAAALFGAAGIVLFLVNPTTPYGQRLFDSPGLLGVAGGMGLWHSVITAGLAVLASIVAAANQLARARRSS